MPAYTSLAEAWLKELLEADAELMAEVDGGVWNEEVEQGTTGKTVVIRYQNSRKPDFYNDALLTFNNDRVYVILTYLIPVIGTNHSFEDLATAADRLDTLLHKAQGEVDGAKLWCVWTPPEHKELVPEGDQKYPELGAHWDISVQPVP